MDAPNPSRRRWRWSLLVGLALVIAAFAAVGGVSLADTQKIDGDVDANSTNLAYGPGHTSCSQLGQAASAALTLHYDGNPNDATSHFAAGEHVTLSFSPDAAAQAAGIIASQPGSTSVPSAWDQSSPDVSVPFSVTVPAGTPDGTYKVGVAASGDASQYSPQGGRPQFVIHVGCSSSTPADQPPTVSEISGSASVNEGDSGTYSVTASDPESETLSYAWSVTGNAVIVGPNDGSSVSLEFTDGPDTVGLSVNVNDGNGHIVTKTLSIDEADVAPTVAFISGDTNVDESSTVTYSYAYSITDPGNDTETVASSCGSLGTISNATDDGASSGSFDCTFPDGLKPATASDVTVQATDSDNLPGNTDHRSVTVNNLAPAVGALTLGNNSGTACLTGKPVTADFGFTDAGLLDALWAVDLNWGDGSTHTQYNAATQGAQSQQSHLYVGAGTWTVNASVTDKDGDVGTNTSAAGAVSLLYSTGQGILQPINYTGPRSLFKLGSTIPVKIKITDCNGTPVSTLKPAVALVKLDGSPDGSSIEDVYSTVPDQGTTMRFTGSPDYQYIYNLGTKNLAAGDYRVTITDSSIAPVSATFSIKK
jgi:hypothetical protein